MPVVVLRPNGDDNGTWIRVPASGNRYDKLADDNATTYINSPGLGTNVYQGLQFTSTTLTGTQRVVAVSFRMNYRFTAAGYVELRFIRGGEVNSKVAIVQQRSGATSASTVSSTWYTADPSGAEWTQGTIDSLSTRLYDKATSAGRVAVYEMFADININNQPTLAAPTVTGNTTSSRPTVTWVYSDADADQQTAWQLKMFSAAQYGAAGFNAATSPASYDSGVHLNDGATFTITKDLINAVTYKAYVKAGQDFNGQKWYSDWTASSSFTMAFEPVPAPALTVVSDNTVPRVRNKISVDTKLNLLTSDDASFEAGLGHWLANSNCAVVASATFALKGVQSMRMTSSAGGDMTAVCNNLYPVAPSQAYTFLANFRSAVSARSCRVEIQWFDGAGVQIGATVNGGSVTDSTANFNTQATLTATSPAGVATVQILVRVLATGAASEVHYVDAVSMSTTSSTTWFAGGASQVDYQLVEFTDLTPQNAAIINLLQPQLALGGEANLDADGFYDRYNKDFTAFDRTQAFQGEGSIRWDVGTNTTSRLDIGSPFGLDITSYLMPAVPGVQYTLSYYVMASTGTHSLRLVQNSLDQTGAVLGTSTGTTNATITTAWQRLTVTHTAAAGAIGMRAYLENINGDLVSYYLDAGQLEEGASATVWHEGQGVAPAWQPVRGALTGLVADQRNGIATCYDREAAPGVTRLYRATNIVAYASGTNGASPASSWVSARLSLLDGGLSVVLKDPQNPAHDLQVRVPSISETIGEDLNELHPVRPNAVQGFGQRPVITSDWISGVGGSLTVQITDIHDWWRLLQMLETKSALLLQFPEGGQRYVRLTGDRSWTREPIGTDGRMTRPSRWSRVINLSFAEVDRPPVLA